MLAAAAVTLVASCAQGCFRARLAGDSGTKPGVTPSQGPSNDEDAARVASGGTPVGQTAEGSPVTKSSSQNGGGGSQVDQGTGVLGRVEQAAAQRPALPGLDQSGSEFPRASFAPFPSTSLPPFASTSPRPGVPFPNGVPRPQNGPGGDTPLVLDLTGRGLIETCTEAGKGPVGFDLRGDGSRLASDWIAGGAALLALDLNGDGRITSGRELFGSGTRLAEGRTAADGFEALRAYDVDGDAAITAHDYVYSRLLLWTDENCDGVSQTSELRSLAARGIASLALAAKRPANVFATVAGTRSSTLLESRFTMNDGTTGLLADVLFFTAPTALNAHPAQEGTVQK
jgi:hypothetical protein